MFRFSEAARYNLEQVRDNSRLAMAFASDLDRIAFADDLKARFACERALLNVSEAVRGLERAGQRNDPPFALGDISSGVDWMKVKGIGNVLRHDYDEIDASLIWATNVHALPELIAVCDHLLADAS